MSRNEDKGVALTINGTAISVTSTNAALSVNNMTERAVCVHKLLSFAMTSGKVKNLETEMELDQHRHYEVRIAEYSTQFKFEFVVEFNILCTRQLFDGPAKGGFASWTDPAHE